MVIEKECVFCDVISFNLKTKQMLDPYVYMANLLINAVLNILFLHTIVQFWPASNYRRVLMWDLMLLVDSLFNNIFLELLALLAKGDNWLEMTHDKQGSQIL